MNDNKSKKIALHCDGCGESWEGPRGMIGALCGSGRVREAVCTCDQWPMPFPCEVH